ncbi:MAG: hypothetical protein QXL86_00860 [Candidatus Aenigmatarchaeota archaeon]
MNEEELFEEIIKNIIRCNIIVSLYKKATLEEVKSSVEKELKARIRDDIFYSNLNSLCELGLIIKEDDNYTLSEKSKELYWRVKELKDEVDMKVDLLFDFAERLSKPPEYLV